ncbi:MAG: nicotinate-nucleotide adenylyltransferase [Flavobacteriales bacterium]|nr:nicotinate-nucleotide adenylyltransferase [Flavobacteriales bacterium]MCB9192660.1 nicotinate-nucleotide adenylyltransferase [Flavobacteriales bacterium]
MKKVALFFGSFNPIHIGHMIIADHVVNHTQCKEVWFVVSPHNPLKDKKTLLADHHRLAMVVRATENDMRFRASDIEFHLDQPSYTVNTLVHLKEKYPNVEFSLLLGGDNLASLHKWKNFESILENHPIICYSRPHFDTSELDLKGNITILDAPLMQISSSHIRKQIAEGHSVKYLMPLEAWQYLDEMNFYR